MDSAQLIQIRRDLHQIPELGYQEIKTQAYLKSYVQKLPQDHLTIVSWRTGLIVKLDGRSGNRTIGFRADIDGLPLKEETGLEFASKHEGKMHACGHDFHMTIALGALTELVHDRPDDHVVFIFQPAEEGPGGAEDMLKSDELKPFWPDCIFALHIAPELPVGTVSSKPGLLFANTSELFIDFRGKGGHAAFPHQTKDMVTAASSFVMQVQQIVSRKVDPLDAAVISIGKIEGGTVQNIIAEHARLEGTIRTLSPETMNMVKKEVERMAAGCQISYDCAVSIDFGSTYYQVDNHLESISTFKRNLQKTPYHYREANMAMTGEDFGYMLKDIPGFMFWLGVEDQAGLHQSTLRPNEDALKVGVEVVTTNIRLGAYPERIGEE